MHNLDIFYIAFYMNGFNMNFNKTLIVSAMALASSFAFAGSANLDHVVVYDDNFEQKEYLVGTELSDVKIALFALVGEKIEVEGFTESNFLGDRYVFNQSNINDVHFDHDKIKSLKVLGDVPETVGNASALYMMNNTAKCLDVAYFVSSLSIPKTHIKTLCQTDKPQELLDFASLNLNLSENSRVNIAVSHTNPDRPQSNALVAAFDFSMDDSGKINKLKSLLGTTGFDSNVSGHNITEVGKKAPIVNIPDPEKLFLKITSEYCVDVSYFVNSKDIDKTLIGEFCPSDANQFAFDFADPALALTTKDSVNFVVESKRHNGFVAGFSATRNLQAAQPIKVDYDAQFSSNGYKPYLLESNVMQIGKPRI